MDKITLNTTLEDLKVKKRGGASYEWQDHAARIANKMGFKPNSSWFKFFKKFQSKKGLINSVYSKIADLPNATTDKYFYAVFYKELKKCTNLNQHGRHVNAEKNFGD